MKSSMEFVKVSNLPGDFGVHHKTKASHNPMFAVWLVKTFGQTYLRSNGGVVDIAGGNGALSYDLSVRFGIKSTLIEPREVVLNSINRKRMSKLCALRDTIRRGETNPNWSKRPNFEDYADDDGVVLEEVEMAAYNSANRAGLPFTHLRQEFHFKPTTVADMYVEQTNLCADNDDTLKNLDDGPMRANASTPVPSAEITAVLEKCTAIIGIHPDQATEPIVDAALAYNKSFAVLPCCVFANENTHRMIPNPSYVPVKPGQPVDESDSTTHTHIPVRTYEQLIQYLLAKDPSICVDHLGFEGRNTVLYRIVR